MKQVGKIQDWMHDSADTRGMKRELPTHAVELARILLTESQKKLKGKEKRLRYMFSGIAQHEGVKEFFQCYHDSLRTGDGREREELKEVYARHRKDVLKAFGMLDAWRLRIARCGFMDELKIIEDLLDDSMSALVMGDDASLLEAQEQQLARLDLHTSLHLLYPPCIGEGSIAQYRRHLERLFEPLELVSMDVDVQRLLPRVDVYQQEDAMELFLSRVRPLLDANARRATPLRLIFTGSDDDRIVIVARACCALRQDITYRKMELGMEIAACLDQANDALEVLERWAQQSEGNRLTVRLIKGEHLDQLREQYARANRGQRLSESKHETGLRLRDLVTRLAQSVHLHLDLATHQLLDIAYACALWKAERRDDVPDFSLYSGVGQALATCLASLGGRVYMQSFHYAAGDEVEAEAFRAELINGLCDSYPALGLSPKVKIDTKSWLDMVQQFQLACNKAAQLRDLQTQLRPASLYLPVQHEAIASELVEACTKERATTLDCYAPSIGSKALSSQFAVTSRIPYDYTRVDYRVESLTHEQMAQLVDTVVASAAIEASLSARLKIWKRCATLLGERRASFIAALVRDAGYRLADADTELAAAITLCHTAIAEMSEPVWGDGLTMKTGGLAVVNASAQRPLLDAVEGILSAHVLGYTVIYKPANNTRRVAELLMKLLGKAGLRSTGKKIDLMLAQCMDNQIAASLFAHPAVDALFCYSPLSIVGENPDVSQSRRLFRSTPSLHALYLRSDANWTQAIADLVESCLRRSSQGIASPHALLVDGSLYDDARFQNHLKDAFASLRLMDSEAPRGDVAPWSTPLSLEQWTSMTTLAEGESWLLAPDAEDPLTPLYRFAVRFGVAEDSPLLVKEQGLGIPHIAVVRVSDAEQAVQIQARGSLDGYATLYSEDVNFIQLWKSEMNAKQLSVNTLRQCIVPAYVGQGANAHVIDRQYGGDFFSKRARWEECGHTVRRGKTAHLSFKPWDLITPRLEGSAMMRLHAACESINYWWEEYYGTPYSYAMPDGYTQERRSCCVPLCLRVGADLSDADTALLLAAALKTGQNLELSLATSRPWAEEYLRDHHYKVYVEEDHQFHVRFKELSEAGVLLRAPHADEQLRVLASKWLIPLRDEPVVAQGRIELMYLCSDQCILERA